MKEFFINHVRTAPLRAPDFCTTQYDILVPVVVSSLVVGAIPLAACIVSRRMSLI